MFVPFNINATKAMQPVIFHLTDWMRGVHLTEVNQQQRPGHRNVAPPISVIWQCLQAELALEKVFWGKTQRMGLVPAAQQRVRQLAVNLGPGHNVPGRCATDQLGFLAMTDYQESLEPSTSVPPMEIWVRNQMQVRD